MKCIVKDFVLEKLKKIVLVTVLVLVSLDSVTVLYGPVFGWPIYVCPWSSDGENAHSDVSDLNDALLIGDLEVVKRLFSDNEIRTEFIAYKSGRLAIKAVRRAAVKGYLGIVKCLLEDKDLKKNFCSYHGGGYAAETAFKAAKKHQMDVFKYFVESIISCTQRQLILAAKYATDLEIKKILQDQIEMRELIEQVSNKTKKILQDQIEMRELIEQFDKMKIK